jgi:hypothetical protein
MHAQILGSISPPSSTVLILLCRAALLDLLLCSFASKYLGSYSNSVSDAASFYRSSNYKDDIAFNAIWLFVATGNEAYKKAAFDFYMKHWNEEDGKGVWDNFDWDSNSWGAVVMLSRFYPNDALLKSRIDGFITSWTKGSQWVQFTPKGLAYSGPWGSLRHVGNALFLMKAYTSGNKNVPAAIRNAVDCSTKQQLGYILGDTGRSFVVGYGTNPPQRPHHRASSCPPLGVQCTWDYFNNPGPNPQTLYGALVGGPGSSDDYVDARNDYIKNEVATDYNAGFTGVCRSFVNSVHAVHAAASYQTAFTLFCQQTIHQLRDELCSICWRTVLRNCRCPSCFAAEAILQYHSLHRWKRQ